MPPFLAEVDQAHADLLHALLMKLISDRGGSVTVNVPDLLAQVADATWVITGPMHGPGPADATWTVERTCEPCQ